ncbi:dipeptidase [Chengkuizengella axinellae]|uniref:Membrane dipeptidase n=1 Tax=Chengkuizengella axinellae TaxID=3064388 RepID=A0ABT9J1A2_9BACL|nr:membrane dipeptidase [Chengkuizengella sp. 2205SS18-9]MDP5275401.1 membrane dipeptidase [Chengkuizengella sp. 2205SS18-9]
MINSTEGLFDFGLNEQQERRAIELHENSIVIDMLFQGPLSPKAIPDQISDDLKEKCEGFADDPMTYGRMPSKLISQLAKYGNIPQFKEEWFASGITAGNRQLNLSDQESMILSMADVQAQFDAYDWLVKARNAEEIRDAKKRNLKAGMISAQETDALAKNLELVDALYDFGLRMLQLTYNNQNQIGAGCAEKSNAGLTNFGIHFIEHLNQLGVLIDTSHCGKQTTLDACTYSKQPVIASHTGVSNIFNHMRCKSDEELKAIAATGGVIGVFAMPWFIHDDPNDTSMNHVLDHIDYVVNLVGVDHVGIGTDWPMSDVTWSLVYFKEHIAPKLGFAKGNGPSTETVKGLEKYSYFINFTRGLMSRGYSDQDIEKIIGGNWLNVFEEVCG